MAVPLGPTLVGERADLVGAGGVPRFGDDLRIGEHRVFGDQLDHRRVRHELALPVAAEDRGQIEAEAIDVVVVYPVAQAMEDHLAHDRVIAVDRVAAAAEVLVRAVVVQHVIDAVFEALEAERGACFVAFGRVVEDDVENHFDAGGVELADHFLELPHLVAGLVARHVAAVGREERHGVVAPVVRADRLGAVGFFDRELVDRHQLDRRDTERFQIRNFFDDAGVGAGLLDVARRAAREAADVRFVDDRFGERAAEMAVALPIEGIVDDDALRRTDDAVFRRS